MLLVFILHYYLITNGVLVAPTFYIINYHRASVSTLFICCKEASTQLLCQLPTDRPRIGLASTSCLPAVSQHDDRYIAMIASHMY
jgi:hypothetical protein